jgi:hypothetical protein
VKRWFIIFLSSLLLFSIWLSLKYLGLIGYQFFNGVNTSEKFLITSINETFELKIQPSKRHIYRYNAHLIFDGEDYLPKESTQDVEVAFIETFCNSQKILGEVELRIHSKSGQSSFLGIGTSGKLIKPNIFERSEQICLKIKIKNLSQPVYPNLELLVFVNNQRPCWGLECMLD